jgi:dipeptidyl aminopeptidase/acylaminoacyl peptidase
MRFTATLLSVLLLAPAICHAQASAPKPHEIEDFIREDKFKEVQMSPDGTYLAVTVPSEDKTVLVVIKPGEPKPLIRLAPRGKKSHVMNVTWVSPERLVYSVGVRDQLDEGVAYMTESWAINADGTRAVQLSGFTGAKSSDISVRTGQNKGEIFAFSIVDDLPEDDDSIIIAVYRPGTPYTTVERMNVNSGSRLKIAQAPVKNADFATDNAGQVRFARGFGTDQMQKVFYRKSNDADWILLNDEAVSGRKMRPLGFSADDAVAYLVRSEPSGPDAIVGYDTASGAFKPLIRDAMSDPAWTINPIGKRYPIGAVFAGPTPRYEYFAPDSPDAKAHRALQRAFPGQVVLPGADVTDKNEVLLYVYGDREPGAYYAMNMTTRKVAPVMFAADWLAPEKLSPMRDIVFVARDGRKIPGWLTLPVGSDGKHLPLVIHPHGGPFGVMDRWGFDINAQLLASHGYAVLQVNFRGSSGYGRDHATAGYKQWGLTMQDDLTDATRWAIAQGIADKDRICIYGASYGGYAALMGVIDEPGLYKCAVGQVGVYDLAKVKADDATRNDYLRTFFSETFNDGDLTALSPNRLASKVTVPVFLSAGREDETAPVEHTEMMEAALKAAGVPVDTLYFQDEGHGIYKLGNRRKFHAHLLTFLQKHLGGRAPVVVATATKE